MLLANRLCEREQSLLANHTSCLLSSKLSHMIVLSASTLDVRKRHL